MKKIIKYLLGKKEQAQSKPIKTCERHENIGMYGYKFCCYDCGEILKIKPECFK